MSKSIEVSINFVDRTDPLDVRSTTTGMLRFDQDNLTAPPEVVNPLDSTTVIVLKNYLDDLVVQQQALATQLQG